MGLKIYNTLSRQKEVFAPWQPGQVSMYVCGVTVYESSHIGHAMSTLTFDMIRRYLEYRNYQVRYFMNFTDIDDKIIQRLRSSRSIGALSQSTTYFNIWSGWMPSMSSEPQLIFGRLKK